MSDTSEIIISYEEGCRLKPYYCSENYPTIGFGCKLGEKYAPLPDLTWTPEQALSNLRNKISSIEKTIIGNPDIAAAFKVLDDVRKAVYISMAYQVGVYGLLKFKKFLAAIEKKDFIAAHDQMLDSLAARQTPHRWRRQAKMMLTGELLENYK